MELDYIRQKITDLRIKKGVSEYKMSLDLGHSKSYVQSISSGRALPSLQEFIAICDYFKITPLQFFDSEKDEQIPMHRTFSADWSKSSLRHCPHPNAWSEETMAPRVASSQAGPEVQLHRSLQWPSAA